MVASMQNLEPNFMYAPISVECILQICLSIDRYCSYAGRRISIDFLYEYRSNFDKDDAMSQYPYLIKLIWRKLLSLLNIQIRFWMENERLLRDSSNNTIIQGGGWEGRGDDVTLRRNEYHVIVDQVTSSSLLSFFLSATSVRN